MAKRPDFDDVRSAFERLDTPEKAAFVFEATFATVGQAIEETGRRVSEAVASLDLDALFRMDGTPGTAPTPTEPVAAEPTPKPKRSSARKKRNPGVPPTDDAPPAV